jgi:hypothetical protein
MYRSSTVDGAQGGREAILGTSRSERAAASGGMRRRSTAAIMYLQQRQAEPAAAPSRTPDDGADSGWGDSSCGY